MGTIKYSSIHNPRDYELPNPITPKAPSSNQVKTTPNFFHNEICGSFCHKTIANLKK